MRRPHIRHLHFGLFGPLVISIQFHLQALARHLSSPELTCHGLPRPLAQLMGRLAGKNYGGALHAPLFGGKPKRPTRPDGPLISSAVAHSSFSMVKRSHACMYDGVHWHPYNIQGHGYESRDPRF